MMSQPQSFSPQPPTMCDDNASDGYFDAHLSLCAKCHGYQIHDQSLSQPHQSCLCHRFAVCCLVGWTTYLRHHFSSLLMQTPVVGGDFPPPPSTLPTNTMFEPEWCPRFTLMVKILHLGCINIQHLEDEIFAQQCYDKLQDLKLEYGIKAIALTQKYKNDVQLHCK